MVKGTENAPETVESICFVQSAQNPYKRFEQIQGKKEHKLCHTSFRGIRGNQWGLKCEILEIFIWNSI